MNFPFFVARRYLFSKKSHNAINVISAISVAGIAFATTALVCTLSVFNGFHDLIGSLYTTFDPQLAVTPAKGKFIEAPDDATAKIKADGDVAVVTQCLEDQALVLFSGQPLVVTLKGVDDSFDECTDIRNILYGNGSYLLHAADVDYGIPGIGLAYQFGGTDYGSLTICAPRKGERINMANPSDNFNAEQLVSPGVIFDVHQRKYDENYILSSLAFAQKLFEQPGKITSIELKLREGANETRVKERLRAALGPNYAVLDRMEQQQEVFGIMNIEKTIAYLFLTFILLVACFNIVGSISMLIIDKRDDVGTLRNLGVDERRIVRIFLFEGRLISAMGAVIGVSVGLLLCWIQQEFGVISLGNGGENFIVQAYPVSIHVTDILLVFATVLVVGFASVWYPVRYLSKRLL